MDARGWVCGAARQTENDRTIAISENFAESENSPGYEGVYTTHVFTFDQVYGVGANQKEVYETTAREAVVSTLQVRWRTRE